MSLQDRLASSESSPTQQRAQQRVAVTLVSHIYLESGYRGKLAHIARNMQLTVVMPRQFQSAYGTYSYDGQQEQLYALRPFGCFYPLFLRTSTRWLLSSVDLGFRTSRPDIVHVENELHSFSVLQALVCRAFFAPNARTVVFGWANTSMSGLKGLILGLLGRIAIRHIDHFIVGNQAGCSLLLAEGINRERILVMPAVGVDESLFAAVESTERINRRKALAIGVDELVIGFVGRFVPEKGVLDLLAAYDLLCARLPDRKLRLLFVGNGSLKGNLEARQPRAVVLSPGRRAAALKYYAVMDVLVLPSRSAPHWREQFGLVLAEAMASGVPVIGSSSGAIPDVIDEAGLVFPEGDVNALAGTLEKVLSNPALCSQLSQRGRERARGFGDEAIAQATTALYLRLASRVDDAVDPELNR